MRRSFFAAWKSASIYRRWFIATLINLLLVMAYLFTLSGYSGTVHLHGQVLSDTGEPLPNTLVKYRASYLLHPFSKAQFIKDGIITDQFGRFYIEVDKSLIIGVRVDFFGSGCFFSPAHPPKQGLKFSVPVEHGLWPLFSSQQIGSTAKPMLYRAVSCTPA